ncbi:MAG: isoprenylcysteine carboxylmethyltransferase family protein [Gammaproteobacteria bacterium]
MNHTEYGFYALLWLSFAVVHSVLASTWAKQLLNPLFGRSYRLSYNLFSALHIGLILVGGRMWLGANAVNLDLGSEFEFFITTSRWVGVGIILAALTQYDLGYFGGLKQLRRDQDSAADDEPLHITGMHRYVRHPLYLGAYFFLWGGITDEFGLQTTLWGCLYLFVGTWFEERKLVTLYGRSYIEYQQKVPAILPLRGRAI